MFFSHSHIFLSILFAVQLSPSIAAPAPLIDGSTALEARATDNTKISLYKNGLPEGNMTIPSTLDELPGPSGESSQPPVFALGYDVQSTEPEQNVALPLNTRFEESRALRGNDSVSDGVTILAEEPKQTDQDERQLGRIGTDVGSLGTSLRRHLQWPGSGSSHPNGGSEGDSAHGGSRNPNNQPKIGGTVFAGPEQQR
ncbi:unnamed protein product [Peniophora sp. CBMAI 1063]|nr:unnamed protein product [Peniophora sp. CBMAI 1063]